MTDPGRVVFYAGLAAMVVGGIGAMIPWKSRRLSPASIQRRVYWTGTIAGALLLFAGALPGWPSAIFASACAVFVMIGTAWRFTSHIKIRGRIYEFMRDPRQPDPPPALRPERE